MGEGLETLAMLLVALPELLGQTRASSVSLCYFAALYRFTLGIFLQFTIKEME